MAASTKSPMDRRMLAVLLLVALGLQWIQNAENLQGVLSSGAWFDTDDAMRMVGVRAWLAGQGWYDLHAHRLGIQPVPMHWSRVVDLPLAVLMRVFGLMLQPQAAEAATRLVFPAGLFLLFMLGLIRAAETVAGPAARGPAILLAALGSMAADQFVPGRIDHHAPQIVLLTFTMACLLRSFSGTQLRDAAAAGALTALSLSISIENMPFVLVIIAAFGLHWIWRGDDAARQMVAFASTLAGTALLLFALTVPPDSRTAEICDAFGAPYLTGLLTGCAVLIICGLAIRSGAIAFRICAAMIGAAIVLGLLRITYPACLMDPFANLPPLLRDVWLKNVSEAQPLRSILADRPALALPLLGPPLIALLGMLWLALRADNPVQRAQCLSLAALCGGGLVAANWMVRTESSLGAPVMIAGAILAAQARHWARPEADRLLPVLLPLILCLPLSSGLLGVAAGGIALSASQTPSVPQGGSAPTSCTKPADFAALAQLSPLRLLGPMDAGPYVLAHSQHSVIAGPYHRNIEGNLASLQTFLAAGDEARSHARSSGATHLIFCRGLAEASVLAGRAPPNLASLLTAGTPPSWLTPVSLPGPWQLFVIN